MTSFDWVRENPSRWDADKARIVGSQPPGIFDDLAGMKAGEPVPGEWWRVADDGLTVGYAWMDRTWDGAEVLLCVDGARRRSGVGTFILDQLEKEASSRGLNQLYNVVRPTHPDKDALSRWLQERGFKPTEGGELRRPIKIRARRSP